MEVNNRFYCKNCDTDFEAVEIFEVYERTCPNCGRLVRRKKPKKHSEYEKTYCNGILEFEGGNQYGCFYHCQKCMKTVVTQTKKQIELHGLTKL